MLLFFFKCKRRKTSKCPIVQPHFFPYGVEEGCVGREGWAWRAHLIPAFPGGHRGCRWIRAPRSATAPSASRASWVPLRSYCSDRWRDWGRRCSLSAGRPDALARLFGFPLPKLFPSLLLASEASTAAAPRAAGPMLGPASLDQDTEEEASCRAWHPLQVSGAEAWLSSAARPPPARAPRGLRSSTAPALALARASRPRRPWWGACCRRGPRGRAPCTRRWCSWSESCQWPAHCCPVPWGSPATGANLGTGSLAKENTAPVGGSCFQKCLRRNLGAGEKDEKWNWFVEPLSGCPDISFLLPISKTEEVLTRLVVVA